MVSSIPIPALLDADPDGLGDTVYPHPALMVSSLHSPIPALLDADPDGLGDTVYTHPTLMVSSLLIPHCWTPTRTDWVTPSTPIPHSW